MLFERIETPGLAHYSYLIGSGHHAIVIDPRRDCNIYIEKASQKGYRITDILETHRNEDYVVGSVGLSEKTGARIWHADGQLPYKYGESVEDNQRWTLGRFRITALSSPGHTPGSMSYVLSSDHGKPLMVFSGDTLFAGDVGRVDLVDIKQLQQMASCLYDTIFETLLPLGDGVIVYPAHGAGSPCGLSIAERPLTTIGFERRNNPMLQYHDKHGFIEHVAQVAERPPYFTRMEHMNLEGASAFESLPVPPALTPYECKGFAKDSVMVDVRMDVCFGSAHIPGSVFLWLEGLPSFAGWFLPYDTPLLIISDADTSLIANRYLARLGYDNIAGYLSGGMLAWHMAGYESEATRMVTVHSLCRELDSNKEMYILDVRSEKEIDETGKIPHAHHIHVTQLPNRTDEIPTDTMVYIFCGSGLRSMIAASYLQREGWKNLTIVLGGLNGWNSTTCPLEEK
jgi:hydroxyacylglutathione hydrolase